MRLRVRRLARMGQMVGAQGALPQGRGARQRALGDGEGDRGVFGSQGRRQQHHPHQAGEHPPDRHRPRPEDRDERQRARHRRPRHGKDALLREAEPHAGKRQLLHHRSQGHPHPRHGPRPRRARLRDQDIRHHRLRELHALQPHRLHRRRGSDAALRGVPHQEHHRRQGPCRGPVLGERREAPLHGPRLLPPSALP